MNSLIDGLDGKKSKKPSEKERQRDNLKELKKFLDHPTPYTLWKAPKLNDELKRRGLSTAGNVKDKKDRLLMNDNGLTPEGEEDEGSRLTTNDKLLDTLICQSFLPSLSAIGLEYCKIGHANEVPLAKKLLEHSQSGLTAGFKIQEISRPGLVMKNDQEFAKGTIDFIALALVPSSEEATLIGIEVKSRTSPGTTQEERLRAQRIRQQNPNRRNTVIDATSKYR